MGKKLPSESWSIIGSFLPSEGHPLGVSSSAFGMQVLLLYKQTQEVFQRMIDSSRGWTILALAVKKPQITVNMWLPVPCTLTLTHETIVELALRGRTAFLVS